MKKDELFENSIQVYIQYPNVVDSFFGRQYVRRHQKVHNQLDA
jgi:hypothetical protein